MKSISHFVILALASILATPALSGPKDGPVLRCDVVFDGLLNKVEEPAKPLESISITTQILIDFLSALRAKRDPIKLTYDSMQFGRDANQYGTPSEVREAYDLFLGKTYTLDDSYLGITGTITSKSKRKTLWNDQTQGTDMRRQREIIGYDYGPYEVQPRLVLTFNRNDGFSGNDVKFELNQTGDETIFDPRRGLKKRTLTFTRQVHYQDKTRMTVVAKFVSTSPNDKDEWTSRPEIELSRTLTTITSDDRASSARRRSGNDHALKDQRGYRSQVAR